MCQSKCKFLRRVADHPEHDGLETKEEKRGLIYLPVTLESISVRISVSSFSISMIIGVVTLEDGAVGVIKRAAAVLLVLIILSDVLGAALKIVKYQ